MKRWFITMNSAVAALSLGGRATQSAARLHALLVHHLGRGEEHHP